MLSHLGKELRRSKYRLLGLVGQGQFGRVFCAVHRQTGRLVALKNLEHERFPTHKFLRELRFLLSLQHDNIVNCQALEHSRTGRYLVMDYCEGGTLRSLMEDETRLSLPQSLKLIGDILAGLDHAHSRGIVHCDIKPENILLSLRPHGWSAKISDFGIARLSQELAEPQSGDGNTGSPAYMAPERFYGQYSKSSDLYSVGIMLFELLAGYRPFSGTPLELMTAHLNKPLKLPESIADVWHPILITALQKLAARRFHSAAEMLAALQQAATAEGLWENPQSIELPLLQPVTVAVPVPLRGQQQASVPLTVEGLAVVDRSDARQLIKPFPQTLALYWSHGNQVVWREYSTESGKIPETSPERSIFLPSPVKELVLRQQKCFAIAPNAIYQLEPQHQQYQTLITTSESCVAALESQGRWMAIARQSSNAQLTQLTFYPIGAIAAPVWVNSQPIPLVRKDPSACVRQIIPLDARHVGVISTQPAANGTPGTWIEIASRRGDRLGCLTLPFPLGKAVLTSTPYRMLATDVNDPFSVVQIDLKPFRVLRLGLEIVPQFMVTTTWGYILSDSAGHILILDEYGQRVGRLESPSPLTAMASFHTQGLLLATQAGNRANLHILNLKQLDLELMF